MVRVTANRLISDFRYAQFEVDRQSAGRADLTHGAEGSANRHPALLGGYVFVPAALFLAARDEAEFAALLAHAMAHIAARQGNVQPTGLASVPLIFGFGGSCTEGGALPVGFTATRRGFELQADALSLQTMRKPVSTLRLWCAIPNGRFDGYQGLIGCSKVDDVVDHERSGARNPLAAGFRRGPCLKIQAWTSFETLPG